MEKPKFFDTHTHLNMQFDHDWRDVAKRTIGDGTWFVNVGADEKSSLLALEQAKELGEGCWATVGLHPTESEGSNFTVVAELAKDDRVVAIGECGLEYYRLEPVFAKASAGKQKELFKKHIDLALELDKPLMIHCRATQNNTKQNDGSPLVTDAHKDILEILEDYRSKIGDKLRFNMHFFTGTGEVAKKFVDIRSYFSFNGVITFTSQYDEVIRNIPLDRIMSETDAPFVAPVPHRGERNEPAYVRLVSERICELRDEPREEVLVALVQNARKFYRA